MEGRKFPANSSPMWGEWGNTMKLRTHLGILTSAIGLLIMAAGCSHFPTSGGGGNNTAPVTLTFHDTPPSGVAVTSFEVTITGAVLQPGNVSLLSAPGQTVELTQFQANSGFLSTTKAATGTYKSLTITYANPKLTILNDTGVSQSIDGQTCAAGQSCVISSPTVSGTLTDTITGFLTGTPPAATASLVIGANQPTLLEVDVNLNNVIQTATQSNFSLDFSKSGAVTANQLLASQATSPIGSLELSGAISTISAVGSNPNQFTLLASTGQTFTNIQAVSTTQFAFQRANCVASNFTCLAAGQIVDVQLQILGSGAFQAAEVDFDDAGSTQQVSGTIVSLTGTPPTSFQMIVHNSVPALASVSVGTPATVTISNTATFFINDGLFVLPSGSQTFSFATSTDLMVGQEVEARVSGTVTSGPPVSFTTDRLALEPSQVTATMFNPNSGTLSFSMNNLPPLFSSGPTPIVQMQVLTSTQNQTQFQTLPTGTFTDLTSATPPNNIFSVGGFLFSSSNPQIPNLAALVVRAQVPGT